jgi:hypothetical protein
MGSFVLYTHTLWSEAPRIRHQVARLIAGAGHDVLFIERAAHPWQRPLLEPVPVEHGIRVARPRYLLHHQLRVVPPLDWLNRAVVRRDLAAILARLHPGGDATLVNFAHDAAFLPSLLPGRLMITIIHDDFEAQARLPWFGHVTRNLRATCLASDRVLAVSRPLVDRLSIWCQAELFHPWTTLPYVPPRPGTDGRDTLLFWGHVDTGLDTKRIRFISAHLARRHPDLRVLIVGPTQVPSRRARTTDALRGLANVEVRDATPLDRLPLERTLAALIPYRRKGDVDATELPNKTLPLLSRGLPILKTGLPAMVRAPFILAVDDDDELDAAINACRANFATWQPAIRDFVESHRTADRLEALGIPTLASVIQPATASTSALHTRS